MPNNQFDINGNNDGVAIVVYNDVHVRPVKWMEVYPSLLNQSKSLLHAIIDCLLLDDDTQNSINILKVAIPLKGVIILAPPAKIRIS